MAGKGEVRYRITADPSGFKKAFKEAGDQVTDFANSMKNRLGPAGNVLSAIGPAGMAAAAAMGTVAAAGAAVGVAVDKALAKADKFSNLSASTGLAAESLQRLAPAAIASGVSIEDLARGINKMQQSLVKSPEKFEALGLSAKRLVELRPESTFAQVAKAASSIENPTKRAAVMMEIFGKDSVKLLPAVQQDLEAVARKADELGLVMSEETVAALDALGDELDLTKEAGGAVVENFGAIVGSAPGATEAVGALGRAFGAMSRAMLEGKGPIQDVVTFLSKSLVLAVNVAANGMDNFIRMQTSAAKAFLDIVRKVKGGDLSGAWSTVANYKAPAITWQDFGAGGAAGAGGGRPTNYAPGAAAAGAKATADAAALSTTIGKAVSQGLSDAMRAELDAEALARRGNTKPTEARALDLYAQQVLERGAALKKAFGLDMDTGTSGLWTRQKDVVAASKEIVDAQREIVEQERAAAEASDTWANRLQVVSDIAQAMGGAFGKAFGALAGGVSGFMAASEGITRIQGQKGLGSLFGGGLTFTEKLGNVSSLFGMAGAAVGVAKTIWGGLKSIFGGDQAKKDAQTAGRILGREVSKEQAKQLAADAKSAGKTFTEYVTGLRQEEDRRKAAEAQQRVVSGLTTARGGAEALMERLAGGGLSEGLSKALETIVAKVGDALAGAGLGYISPALRDSKAYQEAQGTSSEIGTVLQGMREAGKLDQGLLGATGAAAAALKDQAIEAARAAGMEPAEASKAGFAAISDILREQLNAAIASGRQLDASVQHLLDEAKANGIEIMADPMIEQVAVSKESLGVLRQIAGQGGRYGGEEYGGYPPQNTYASAGGFGDVLTPRVVHGTARFTVHDQEGVLVVPRNRMSRRGRFAYISAARGYYERDQDGLPRDPRAPGGAGAGDAGGGAGGAADVTTGGGSTAAVVEVLSDVTVTQQRAADALQRTTAAVVAAAQAVLSKPTAVVSPNVQVLVDPKGIKKNHDDFMAEVEEATARGIRLGTSSTVRELEKRYPVLQRGRY